MARKRKVDDDDDDTPKKRRKAAVVDDDDDDDDSPQPPKPSNNDAYTGLALLTFVGLVAACVIFYLDAEAVGEKAPPAPSITVPALGGPVAAPPQPDA